MDLEQWTGVLDQLMEAGCLFLAFTGGEPLLRRDIFAMLTAAADRHFAVTLQTNATLLDREKVRFLGRMPTLMVDVSPYGSRPRTHDYLTGESGSFTATRRSLDLLKERGGYPLC